MGTLLLFLLCMISTTLSAISGLLDTKFNADQVYSEREGIFALSDTPMGTAIPQISFTFHYRPLVQDNKTIASPIVAEVVLLHSSLIDKIGRVSLWRSDYCCSSALMLANLCDVPDRLIIGDIDFDPNKNGHLFYYWSKNISAQVPFNETVEPLTSGFWYLIFANCDVTEERTLIFSGSTLWKSPFGYLPAQAFGSMIVYWNLSFLYFIAFVIWGYLMFKNQKDLHKYQYAIMVLLMSSLIEELLKGGVDIEYNAVGIFNIPFMGVGIFFSSLKLTLIRFLLLLIAHGYAITVPSISQPIYAGMLTVCFAYFVATAVDEYVHLYSLERLVSTVTGLLSASFIVVFNLVIISWIGCRTFNTMKEAQKETNEKYQMYKNLIRIFGVICIIASIAFFVTVIIHFMGLEDTTYRWYWLIDTYWDFIYYIVNCYIAYVWRPTDNNQRYAYIGINDTENLDANNNIDLEIQHSNDDASNDGSSGEEMDQIPLDKSSTNE